MNTNDYSGISDLYDIYVPAEFDIDFFLQETKEINGPVLELMAGTGRVSLPLIKAGVDLTCEDSSPEMLAILDEKLRSRNLQAHLVSEDVCSIDFKGKFDAVIIPFNSFAHLTTVDQQKMALIRIHDSLIPGGVFICTLSNPQIRRQQIDGNLRLFRKYSLPETGGSLLLWLLEKFHSKDPQVVETSEFFEEYDRMGNLLRKRYMELHFRLSERQEFEALAASAGFDITAFFGNFDRTPFESMISQHMIWKFKAA